MPGNGVRTALRFDWNRLYDRWCCFSRRSVRLPGEAAFPAVGMLFGVSAGPVNVSPTSLCWFSVKWNLWRMS